MIRSMFDNEKIPSLSQTPILKAFFYMSALIFQFVVNTVNKNYYIYYSHLLKKLEQSCALCLLLKSEKFIKLKFYANLMAKFVNYPASLKCKILCLSLK